MAPAFNPLPAGVVGLEITDDLARGHLWLVCENSVVPSPLAMIFQIDRVTMGLAAGTVPLVTDELDAGGGSPPGADIDGPTDGVAVLPSGNLLVSDFNGDVLRFDDTLFELNPGTGGATATLVNVWYLDSATPGCAGCRPNTNTNVPLQRIEQVLGVDTSGGGIGGPGPIFVGALQGFFGISHVTLTPGLPGTWNLVRRYLTPTAGAVLTLDHDSDQAAANGLPNAYWMTSDIGVGLVYETTFTPGVGFAVNQCFPTPLVPPSTVTRLSDAVCGIRGTAAPHQLAGWRTNGTATTSTGVRYDAGIGAVPTPHPMEGDLLHSLLANSPRGGGEWERSASVLDEEISLWSRGRLNAHSHTTRESLPVLMNSTTTPTVALDIDAIDVVTPFAGTDPGILDLWLSIEVDTTMGNPAVLVDESDVFRILPTGAIFKLATLAQIQAAVSTTVTTIDLDALEVLANGDLIVSFLASFATAGNPNLPATVLATDVLLIPAPYAANSAIVLWTGVELSTIALGQGHTYGANTTNVERDPLGNGARPNPNPGGTTRPDLLFQDQLGTVTSHVFSTRNVGGTDGAIARHRLTFGYGSITTTQDALASHPGTTPSPTMDTLNTVVPAVSNNVNLFGRNLGANGIGYWGIAFAPTVIPALDLRPAISHNPLSILPSAFIPFFADANGTAEFNITLPTLGAPLVVYVQVVSLTRAALSPVAFLTLQ
jgi:hypothetical protein